MGKVSYTITSSDFQVNYPPRHPVQIESGAVDIRHNLSPVTPLTDNTWVEHKALMEQHDAFPGWAFARFGVRSPTLLDFALVAGIVRAPFGIWWNTFLCTDPEINHHTTRGLAVVSHIPSGMPLTIFADMATAVEAAEIASRLSTWDDFCTNGVVHETNTSRIARVKDAWTAAGIVNSSFIACPLINGEPVPGHTSLIIRMKNPMADRPNPEERPS